MNNNYYQSDIRTSRQEDGIYAIKYASQQMLIDKLQQKLEAYENMRKEVLKELHKYNLDFYDKNDLIKNSIDILNKVGSDK